MKLREEIALLGKVLRCYEECTEYVILKSLEFCARGLVPFLSWRATSVEALRLYLCENFRISGWYNTLYILQEYFQQPFLHAPTGMTNRYDVRGVLLQTFS